MKIPPIETEEEAEAAHDRLAMLIDAEEGTPEAEEREAILEALEDYEDQLNAWGS